MSAWRWLIVLASVVVLAACADPRAGQPTATPEPPTPTPDPNATATPGVAPDGRLLPVTILRENFTESTTLTLAGSPYMLLLPIQIPEGVTVTIEPGVVVYVESGVTLSVFGVLNANQVTFRHWDVNETWQGIALLGAVPSNLTNNRIYGAQNGIRCENSFPNLVGNDIGPVAVNGIVCFLEQPPPVNWNISGNNIHDTGQAGIQLWVNPALVTSNPFQITANTISNTGQHGIGVGSTRWLQNEWANANLQLLISNNSIQTSGSDGILLQFVSGVSVQRNIVSGASGNGLNLTAHSSIVGYNWFTASGQSGVVIREVRGQPIRDVVVQCNLVDQNQLYGLEIIRAEVMLRNTALTVVGNDLANNGQYALAIRGAKLDLALPGNWWGTPDAGQVETLVLDQLDDETLPRVTVAPVRAGAPVREPGFCP